MTLTRRTPLRTRSQKLARLQRVYSKLRREFLTEHAWCIRCGRESRGGPAPRRGVATCLRRLPHVHITEHPAESIERGWSLPRIGATS